MPPTTRQVEFREGSVDNSKRSILLRMIIVVLLGGQLGFAQEGGRIEITPPRNRLVAQDQPVFNLAPGLPAPSHEGLMQDAGASSLESESPPPEEWVVGGIPKGVPLVEPDRFFPEHGPLTHYFQRLDSSGTRLWRGHWYTEQAAVAMIRMQPHLKTLSHDLTDGRLNIGIPVSTQDALSTESDTAGANTGVRITIGNIIGRDEKNRDNAIEVTFLGQFDFESTATIGANSAGNLVLSEDFGSHIAGTGSFEVPVFDNADTQSFIYNSDLSSFELNYRIRSRMSRDRVLLQPNGNWVRAANPTRLITLHGGLRYISINEYFRFDSEGVGSGTGLYEVLTHNDAVGFQLGGGLIEQKGEWNWGVKSTAGALFNAADRQSVVVTMPAEGEAGSRAQDIEGQNLVFLCELSAFASWQIRPHVALKGSYDAMLVTGLAIARDNVSLAPAFPDLALRGQMFYHAISVGFEMVW